MPFRNFEGTYLYEVNHKVELNAVRFLGTARRNYPAAQDRNVEDLVP
jgi:hypothetical protein